MIGSESDGETNAFEASMQMSKFKGAAADSSTKFMPMTKFRVRNKQINVDEGFNPDGMEINYD